MDEVLEWRHYDDYQQSKSLIFAFITWNFYLQSELQQVVVRKCRLVLVQNDRFLE